MILRLSPFVTNNGLENHYIVCATAFDGNIRQQTKRLHAE